MKIRKTIWLQAVLSAIMLIFIMLMAGALYGQEASDPLSRIIELYDNGDYRAAADSARNHLHQKEGADRNQQVQLLIYLSFSLVALGQEDEAEGYFSELLRLDPQVDLNPEFVSPKIIEVFRKARAKVINDRSRTPPLSPPHLVIRAKPAKSQILWRSLLWPGWGQRYRGSRLKANILQAGSLGAVAGWGFLELGTRKARQEYLAGIDPEEIQRDYQSYNRWYRARNAAINLIAAIWLYNLADALIAD